MMGFAAFCALSKNEQEFTISWYKKTGIKIKTMMIASIPTNIIARKIFAWASIPLEEKYFLAITNISSCTPMKASK
jgi:hypothetical protein